jgi:hypothetical protein
MEVTMPRKVIMVLAITAGFLAVGVPVFAHHGNVAYDEKSRATIKGIVTDFVWSNPHCQIYLDVKDDGGSVTHWGVETNSPGVLLRDGWKKTSLKAGDKVTLIIVASKSGAPVGYVGAGDSGTKVTFDDGRVLDFSDKTPKDAQ